MQQYADIYLLQNHATCVHRAHHQQYIKLQLQPLVQIITIWGASFLKRDQIRTDTAFGSCSKSSQALLVIAINTDVDVGLCQFP